MTVTRMGRFSTILAPSSIPIGRLTLSTLSTNGSGAPHPLRGRLVPGAPRSAFSCLGRGVLFLGNHLPRHPHGAGIVSAAGAGERALYPVWRHHAGFREGARSLLAAREGAGGGVFQRAFHLERRQRRVGIRRNA